MARLTATIPLVERDFVPLSFIDVPRDPYQRATPVVYERNRIELLRDLYVWACERSAARPSGHDSCMPRGER